MRYLGFFILVFFLASCSGYSDQELEEFDNQIQAYLDSTGIQMDKTEEGMYYSIIEVGEGDDFIGFNDQVTFFYEGTFLDGKIFQETDKNEPLTFRVKQLIFGWQDALMMLKEGGRIQIILPPQLAYGKKISELIPQNSILKYDLTVMEVE